MRARRVSTQSALINALLAEEEERLLSEQALRESVGGAGEADFDARLL